MKKGLLVYDADDAQYNKWFIEHIIETGKENGLEISLMLTHELNDMADDSSDFTDKLSDYSFAIMRNRNKGMSEAMEKAGIRCFNSSYVCGIGNDKWEMYKDFVTASIPVMYTQESKLPYPFVMKPKNGHGGKDVNLVNNEAEYQDILSTISNEFLGNKEFIYQMVASERGRDIRVYVVGDMILTAMERQAADSEFRANFSLGGSASEHALTEDELKLAAKVQNHIKADFAGIDIIYNNGKPIVNEIEDAVGTRMLYANTDIDAVREYIKWINKSLG